MKCNMSFSDNRGTPLVVLVTRNHRHFQMTLQTSQVNQKLTDTCYHLETAVLDKP